MNDHVGPRLHPELLRRFGPSLASMRCCAAIAARFWQQTTTAAGSDWRAWLDHFGRPDAACHAGQRFSEAGMLINAALLGLGVALARASLVGGPDRQRRIGLPFE